MGTCRYCNKSAGFLRKQHGQCRDLHTAGIQEMTQLAAQGAGTSSFNETALRTTLQSIATRARATEEDISQAIAAGFAQGVKHALQDGTLTADEETSLHTFRDRMANHDLPSVITGSTTLDRAAADRITGMAKRAALDHGGGTLQELDNALRRTSMSNTHRRQLLVRAWEEESVAGSPEARSRSASCAPCPDADRTLWRPPECPCPPPSLPGEPADIRPPCTSVAPPISST